MEDWLWSRKMALLKNDCRWHGRLEAEPKESRQWGGSRTEHLPRAASVGTPQLAVSISRPAQRNSCPGPMPKAWEGRLEKRRFWSVSTATPPGRPGRNQGRLRTTWVSAASAAMGQAPNT